MNGGNGMNENRGLWRGKRINNKEHNGEWVEGFLYPVKYTGSTIPGGIDYYIGTYPSGAGMQQLSLIRFSGVVRHWLRRFNLIGTISVLRLTNSILILLPAGLIMWNRK